MLQFDYDEADGQLVTAVLGEPDGANSWWRIALAIGDRALILTVDEDTDKISVSLEATPSGEDWALVEPLQAAVGNRLGWCWVGRNYRGYLDSFTLSFDGLEPQVLFLAEASALKIKRISPARA